MGMVGCQAAAAAPVSVRDLALQESAGLCAHRGKPAGVCAWVMDVQPVRGIVADVHDDLCCLASGQALAGQQGHAAPRQALSARHRQGSAARLAVAFPGSLPARSRVAAAHVAR